MSGENEPKFLSEGTVGLEVKFERQAGIVAVVTIIPTIEAIVSLSRPAG